MINPPPFFPRNLPTAEGPNAAQIPAEQDSAVFETDYSYERVPQRIGDVEKHHYFGVFPFGPTGASQSPTGPIGLAAGAVMRVMAEKNPQVWIISVSSKTGGGNILVWNGEPGGPAIPVGLGGSAVLPARGPNMSLQAVGGTAIGVVIALGGFTEGVPSPTVNVGTF